MRTTPLKSTMYGLGRGISPLPGRPLWQPPHCRRAYLRELDGGAAAVVPPPSPPSRDTPGQDQAVGHRRGRLLYADPLTPATFGECRHERVQVSGVDDHFLFAGRWGEAGEEVVEGFGGATRRSAHRVTPPGWMRAPHREDRAATIAIPRPCSSGRVSRPPRRDCAAGPASVTSIRRVQRPSPLTRDSRRVAGERACVTAFVIISEATTRASSATSGERSQSIRMPRTRRRTAASASRMRGNGKTSSATSGGIHPERAVTPSFDLLMMHTPRSPARSRRVQCAVRDFRKT